MDTTSFVLSLRRFLARRGSVELLRSDNGSNFVGAERELREALRSVKQTEVQNAMSAAGVKWVFNPPYASHFGGVWERQIRSVRRILASVMKQQELTDEGLATMFCEVEAIINSRPLTKLSDDPDDLEALTPNHLLTLKGPGAPIGTFTKRDVYAADRWKQIQYLADVFWRRWLKEYLPSLQERQKWSLQRRNVTIGDIVLVMDDKSPRCTWSLGKILEVFPDKVGLVRTASVKTQLGTYTRPISKLCLVLEGDLPEAEVASE